MDGRIPKTYRDIPTLSKEEEESASSGDGAGMTGLYIRGKSEESALPKTKVMQMYQRARSDTTCVT